VCVNEFNDALYIVSLRNVVSVRTAFLWVIAQRVVLISYRRFGATYRLHSRGSRIQKLFRMRPTGCPETSLRNYHYLLRKNPEERSSQLLRGGSLKSRVTPMLNIGDNGEFLQRILVIRYVQYKSIEMYQSKQNSFY
jgi:hypothetical protein